MSRYASRLVPKSPRTFTNTVFFLLFVVTAILISSVPRSSQKLRVSESCYV